MYILGIDQGTTSTRVVLYDLLFKIINTTQKEVRQIYPDKGWLEHDPEEIFNDLILLINNNINQSAQILHLDKNSLLEQIISIGITNQRETTVLWDKSTGKPVHNAIVWQDRRTTEYCNKLKADNLEGLIQQKTGLLIDPYFSASKINWLLSKYNLYNNKNILFGTIDSYIIWKLTNGASHFTDITNASRTKIFNINNLEWDKELLKIFNIPEHILPIVKDCADNYGETDKSYFGAKIAITGVAGDQQAATVGQLCFKPSDAKITYGTGCFVLQNTGSTKVLSKNKLLTTIAYKVKQDLCYGLEGSIFVAGAAVQWLRDAMKLITNAQETEHIAKNLEHNHGVYLVPAFTGLGAPHWDPNARGAIFGLTRDTGLEHIVRATLESVCYQTRDLLSAFANDYSLATKIKVDGGMTTNNWFLQFLADVTQIDIEKPLDPETTIKGAAMLAAIGSGIYNSLSDLPSNYSLDNIYCRKISVAYSNELYHGWLDAINKVKTSGCAK